MAKLAFSKLNKIKSLPAQIIQFNDCDIEVEQYLPLEKKLALMESVISQAGNSEQGFFNIVQLEAYYRIEVIAAYTNISFTDKQLSEPPKLYDALLLNGVWDAVKDAIPTNELEYIWNNVLNLAKETTAYTNSVLGVLKTITDEKTQMALDATELMDILRDPQQLTLLKGMVEKTGLVQSKENQ